MRRSITLTAAAVVLGGGCVAAETETSESSVVPDDSPRVAGESAARARVRELNARALAVYAEHGRARSSTVAGLRLEGSALLRERAEALDDLIREDPAGAVELAFAKSTTQELGAAFPGAPLEEHGRWEGSLVVAVADDATLAHGTRIHRLSTAGETVEVSIAGARDHRSGEVVEVSGVRLGGRIAAYDGNVVTAAVGETCQPTGAQRAVVLLVTFPGVPAPATPTRAGMSALFNATNAPSVDGFWREASGGLTSVHADVFGWYTLDARYGCNDYWAMEQAAIAAADRDVDFTAVDRIFIVFPADVCPWAGLGTIGCAQMSSPGDGSFVASTTWELASWADLSVTVHEGGHNLGLHHASTRDFGAEVLGPIGAAGVLDEYGDPFSAMGNLSTGHYAEPHKVLLGWQAVGDDVIQVEDDGDFVVGPEETASTNPHGLRVRRGSGNEAWLWLEYRQPIGDYDQGFGDQVYSGALVHLEDETTWSHSHLVDFTTATDSFYDAALAARSSWTDPYSNLTISLGSAGAAGLAVSVRYGSSTCVTSDPTVTLSPPNPSITPGSSAAFSVAVENRDSGPCGPGTFDLSSSLPAGWGSALSSSAVTIAPGATATVTLTKTAPSDAATGTYGIDATVTRAGVSVTATANCTVVPPPPALALTLSVPSATVQRGATVPIRAEVRTAGLPARRASVAITLTRPDGSITRKTLSTATDGTATWRYRVGNKTGLYTVRARATYGAQSTEATPISFTVQ